MISSVIYKHRVLHSSSFFFFFFFNDTATTEIYTLSLHDALPIWGGVGELRGFCKPLTRHTRRGHAVPHVGRDGLNPADLTEDRKSTRLNSSHGYISYAVFCLKKKKKKNKKKLHKR